MVVVPADWAETKPEVAFTVATVVLLLLQLPPVEVDEKLAVAPTQRFWLPLSTPADGGAVTVIVRVAEASGHPPEPVTV